MKRNINNDYITVLYRKLLTSFEIPIVETNEITSKGLYLSNSIKNAIYIKQSLTPKEKLLVALHEITHYIHLAKYYENESRAECELIAECTTFFVLNEMDLHIVNEVDLTIAIEDVQRIEYIAFKVQSISQDIIEKLKPQII